MLTVATESDVRRAQVDGFDAITLSSAPLEATFVPAAFAGVSLRHGRDEPVAQISAPAERDIVSIDPMTAPVDALVTGADLRLLPAGDATSAAFEIGTGAE